MTSNSSSEYKVVADKIVSPDEDLIIQVRGGVYMDSVETANRLATMADIGEGGGGGPLVVPVNIKDGNDENFITFSRTGTGTARIETPQDDLSLRSARDITLFAGNDGPGNVYIGWGDATYTPDAANRVATIADIEAANTADFVFSTAEAPDYESTMAVTNNDMVIKTVVNTEANGNIRVESAQDISLDSTDDIDLRVGDAELTKARINLDRNNGEIRLSATARNSAYFDSGWGTGIWSGTTVSFSDAVTLSQGIDAINGNIVGVSINNGAIMQYGGGSSGDGGLTIIVDTAPYPEVDPVTVITIDVYYTNTSNISIDQDDDQEIRIYGNQIRVDIESTETVNIESSGSDVEVMANQSVILQSNNSDVLIRANDDIEFTSNNDQGETPRVWKMTGDGRLGLPGNGFIKSVIDGSSDGLNNNTIEIVPDFMLWDDGADQYLVIEPTMAPTPEEPTHIHIRPGGTIDASTTNLILGGERNNVVVSDTYKSVAISTAYRASRYFTNLNGETGTQFIALETADIQVGDTVSVNNVPYIVDSVTPIDEATVGITASGAVFDATAQYIFTRDENYENMWSFDSEGVFSGPYMGGVVVPSLVGKQDSDLYIQSPNSNVYVTAAGGDIVLDADGGSYIGSDSTENQIATVGDLDIPVTSVIYVDYLRADSYTASGSQRYPFKTLADALDMAGTLSPSGTNPIRIVLVSGNTLATAEVVTINSGHIFIVGEHSSGTHAPILWYGQMTFDGLAASISDNHFSITGLSINAVSNQIAINFSGDNPQRLFLKDVWLTGNGASDAMVMQNVGAGSTVHGNDLKFSHNGTGHYHAINILNGTANLDAIETSGALTGIFGVHGSLNLSNSEIDSAGAYAIDVYSGGVLSAINTKIRTTAANSSGIELSGAGAVAILGNISFSVPAAGTGRAIDGVAGTVLYYGPLYFSPDGVGGTTNTKVDPDITALPISNTMSRA